MTRLVLFFSSLNIGGTERSMLNLSNQFKELGLDVVLVLLRNEGVFANLVPKGVPIIALNQTKNTFFALPGFIRAMKDIEPDAVLSAGSNVNFVAIWARFFLRKRMRLVVSERSSLSMQSQSGNRLSLRLRPLLEKWFYPFADAVVAISASLAEDIAKTSGIPRSKITVIYNPVYTAKLPILMKEPVPAGLFPSAIPVILGVGRLVEIKDFKTLIHAFAKVRADRPARLIILGEGPLRESLEKLVVELGLTDDICLPGSVINPFAYMARASVVVLSSKFEGFANVLAESLACGTPVVSTDCKAGPAEILENGRFGKLVSVGDIPAMAKAIQDTLDAPPDRTALQNRASFFSAKNSAKQYLHLLFPDIHFDGKS